MVLDNHNPAPNKRTNKMDYVLIRTDSKGCNWFLGKQKGSETNNIKHARKFPNWQSANNQCIKLSKYKFCTVDDYKQVMNK